MKIGVICEGHADRAVIINILTGLTGLDSSAIEPLRPVYAKDETDKAIVDPLTFSNWSIVKQECESRELIDGFLAIEDQEFITIHIDSAESHEYGIIRPDRKSDNYCQQLRKLIIDHMNNVWFGEDLSEVILYAIAIEEIDAWILTIFEKTDTSKFLDAKGRLGKALAKQNINSTSNFENYIKLSKSLSKTKLVNRNDYLEYNCSLKAFYQEIIDKVMPKMPEEHSDKGDN